MSALIKVLSEDKNSHGLYGHKPPKNIRARRPPWRGGGGGFTLRFGDELLNRLLEPGWAYTRIQEETPVSHRQDEQALLGGGAVGGASSKRQADPGRAAGSDVAKNTQVPVVLSTGFIF